MLLPRGSGTTFRRADGVPASPYPPGAKGTRMTNKIAEIKGMASAAELRLQGANITTADELLRATAAAHDRAELAKKIGVEPAQLTEWLNRADLMRLKGVGTETA